MLNTIFQKMPYPVNDVILQAENYTGTKSEFLGRFQLQDEMVQGRPTYKKPGMGELSGRHDCVSDQFLFYTTGGYWMVGPNTNKEDGFWLVESAAWTPDTITETWKVIALGVWTDVPTAQILPI